MKFKKIFSNWAVKNILLSIIVVAALAGIFSILMRQITHHGEKLSVPDLTGMSVVQASQEAKKYKMRIDVTDSIYVRNIKRGGNIGQGRQTHYPDNQCKKSENDSNAQPDRLLTAQCPCRYELTRT